MSADGARAVQDTAIYVAPLRENIAALRVQSAMIFKATEAAMDSKKRLDRTKLLLSLPKTSMTKAQLDYAIKKAKKRILDGRMVKERVKERSSRPRPSPEDSSPLSEGSNRSGATEPISGERVERRDPSYGACESKTEDDADASAAKTLSLLAVDAARQEPQLQDEAGDSCSNVEQALLATNDTGNVTDHATSDATMCAASGLQNVDAKLSTKEQEVAQLREQIERDKATAEQDISRLKTQLQATRVMLRSQPANIAQQLKDQQRIVFEDQSRARERLEMQFRAKELEMKKLEDHLAAKAKELERAQICLRCHEVSTGVDEGLSAMMDAF